MSKVDLNRIPNWTVGKWYFYNGQWLKMERTDPVGQYPLYADCFLFAKDGKFNPHHELRDLLEPWEAAILLPECKATAPDGVDWSVPESIEPVEMPTPEAQPLPEDIFKQNRALLARNAELKTTCDRLQYFEAENKELKTENERLKTGNKMYAKSWSKQANEILDLEDRVADLEDTVNVLKQRLEVANGIIGDLTITMKIREL